jgi:TldD protein
MRISRRGFLGATGSAAALAGLSRPNLGHARGLLTEPLLDEVVQRTLDQAKRAGASYADVRVVRRRSETIRTREAKLEHISDSDEYGIGVRVIADGAWGFAATPRVTVASATHAAAAAVAVAKANAKLVTRAVQLAENPAHVDVWQTPLTKDPFKIPLEDKVEWLLSLNAEAMKVEGVRFAEANHYAMSEWKLLSTSEGASIEQQITRLAPAFEVTAIDDKHGEFASVAHPIASCQAGWEYLEASSLHADSRRLGELVVEKLAAASVTPGKRELVIDPSQLWLTIHESIGHPTELDRALGYEANFAGTSYATPDKLGKLRIAAPHLNFYADKTTPGGLATCGYDDDGVKTQRWDLVKNGLFVGYQTTRDQAALIGESASRGTCYADSFASVPFQRMPNVSLAAGDEALSLEDLVAATQDGVLVSGVGSWSIDHQRLNFEFSGQLFWEIKHGKRTRMLRDVAYHANTLEFWNACSLIGGARSWRMSGAMNDGKGEPMQSNAVSHGCPPAQFKAIQVLNTHAQGV